MPLVAFDRVSLAFGDRPLLDEVSWNLDARERVALVGRNGSGKSTMLKLLTLQHLPDDGRINIDKGVQVSYLPQDLPDADDQRVFDVVASGVNDLGEVLSQYHALTLSNDPDLDKMAKLQTKIEAADGWAIESRIETILQKLDLNADQRMSELSGGWRRRVLLGKALLQNPDVLLLDEPTNHLDMEAIKWLEDFLLDFQGALVFITHDRSFLNRLATRIIELDRGHLTSFVGTWEGFQVHKEKLLEEEANENALFDKKLAKEEVWIRQGIKARRTRNEGRVRALKAMRNERSQRREVKGNANFEIQSSEKSGKLVFELEDFSFNFSDKRIVNHLTTQVQRGDRIALVGANGTGKSTIIKLLLGELEGYSGHRSCGTKLEVAYFDQLRDTLDADKTVIDTLSEGRDFIEINGKNRHVISYLEDFLFSPDRVRQPVKVLSGGESNRLMLAKLFSKPSNLLVLDEPTNDLDVETLELLEELVSNYDGTVLLVSHDRTFIDNVVTHSWSLDGNGNVGVFIGGYSDIVWQQEAVAKAAKRSKPKADSKLKETVAPKATPKKAVKLSYKVQREYDQLPELIEQLEKKQAELQETVGASEFYQLAVDEQQKTFDEISKVEAELEQSEERWMEIEEMVEALQNA